MIWLDDDLWFVPLARSVNDRLRLGGFRATTSPLAIGLNCPFLKAFPKKNARSESNDHERNGILPIHAMTLTNGPD